MDAYRLTQLTDPEILCIAIIRRFPREEWGNALNVARLESAGYDRFAHNTNGEDSRGMFQINVVPQANPQYADVDLYDIEENVRVAAEIYQAWGNWGAWYNSAVALGLPH